ncbi:MAG: GTPase domain-containing protein, partial [Planctomycetales bacterium]
YQSTQSEEDLETADRKEAEPLRILLVGQVKTGKSSLLNALFGESKAAVDVVPMTRGADPYRMGHREGIPDALIHDTAGYEDADRPGDVLKEHLGQVMQSDLVLLVVSAKTAARKADRELLDALKEEFDKHPERDPPPLLVALTHVHQLRPFREWKPPYDLRDPQGSKAQNIAEAVETSAEELQLDPRQVVPVCLKTDQLYNVEEALVPAMMNQLDDARRAKYLRCLKEFKEEDYWNKLGEQAAGAGKFLFQGAFHAGLRVADQTVRGVDRVRGSLNPPKS